jgi:hypothetical protein
MLGSQGGERLDRPGHGVADRIAGRFSVRPQLTTAGHHHQALLKGPGPPDHALVAVDLSWPQ